MGFCGLIFRALLWVAALNVIAFLVLWEANVYLTPTHCDVNEAHCPDAFFSLTYHEARAKFSRAAAKNGIATTAHTVHYDARTNMNYTTDVAVVKGGKPGVLVHTSGVHGVEGFAGSGIQVAFLERLATQGAKALESLPTIVFVHAVNPFGFAHSRRFNENNVDLNRNHHDEEGWKQMLARDPNFARYDSLRNLLMPSSAPNRGSFYYYMMLAVYYVLTDYLGVKRALVTGQYHEPLGPYFGGNKTENSLLVLTEILQPWADTKDKVVVIDVHTGLGPKGHDTVMMDQQKDYDHSKMMWGDTIEIGCAACDTGTGDAGPSGGYQDTKGFIDYDRIFKSPTYTQVTEEFGTVPGPFVATTMIIENAAYVHAPWSRVHEYWMQRLRDVFYIPTVFWKREVTKRGLHLIDYAAKSY